MLTKRRYRGHQLPVSATAAHLYKAKSLPGRFAARGGAHPYPCQPHWGVLKRAIQMLLSLR